MIWILFSKFCSFLLETFKCYKRSYELNEMCQSKTTPGQWHNNLRFREANNDSDTIVFKYQIIFHVDLFMDNWWLITSVGDDLIGHDLIKCLLTQLFQSNDLIQVWQCPEKKTVINRSTYERLMIKILKHSDNNSVLVVYHCIHDI